MECVGTLILGREIFSPLDRKYNKVATRLVSSKKRDKESKAMYVFIGSN